MLCFDYSIDNSPEGLLENLSDVLYKTQNLFEDSKNIHIYPYLQWCSSTMHAEKRCFTDSNKIIIKGNITIEFMFAGINMFWARLRLILARAARRGLK